MNNKSKFIGINSLQSAVGNTRPLDRPVHGWLKAVREALGLPRSHLAKRLRVSVPTIQNYEKREKADTITLASLRKAAAAMDCELVVALVPGGGQTFAELSAKHDPELAHLQATEHSMRLEDQGSDDLNISPAARVN